MGSLVITSLSVEQIIIDLNNKSVLVSSNISVHIHFQSL